MRRPLGSPPHRGRCAASGKSRLLPKAGISGGGGMGQLALARSCRREGPVGPDAATLSVMACN